MVTMVSVSAFVGNVQNSQELTHEKNLVDSKDAAEYFVRTMQGLDDRLGPLLLQLPPDFTVEGRTSSTRSWLSFPKASLTPSRCATGAG